MQVGKQIAKLFLKSPIYYASLGHAQFERLYNVLSYKRKGSGEKGLKILLNKQFDYGGQDITCDDYKAVFKRCKNNDSKWAFQINSFAWLRDLAEVGSNDARVCARELIRCWLKENSSWSENNWSSEIIGKRFFFLLSFYYFYGRSSDNIFKHMLFNMMHKHEKHLKKFIRKDREKDSYGYLQAVKGLIFTNIYFSKNKDTLESNMALLKNSLNLQMLREGCHKSRNIFVSFKILRSLMDIEYILKNSRSKVPTFLTSYIHVVTKFIKSVIYKDGEFPIFNDSFEYDAEKISDTMRKIDFRVKTVNSFPHSGYEKVSAGKTNVLISTATEDSNDRHFGVGSFEMQSDKNRIIVNCGAYIHEPKWKKALQETDAHSVLIIDKKDNVATTSVVNRRKNKQSTTVSISNSGYEKNCRAHVSRKFLVSDDGRMVVGTDMVKNAVAKDVVIRFHMHPSVTVSNTKNKKHILLKVGKSSGWLFKSSSDNLYIEDSIYFGKGRFPQQSKQVVIREKIPKGENSINWMLERQN